MGFHGETGVQRGPQDLNFIRELDVCTSDVTGFQIGKRLEPFGCAKQNGN